MSNSFRIEASEMQAWHAALASRIELRGVPAIAKELEAHLMKKGEDGAVVVTRHQLFTWAEALAGAAARDPRGSAAGAQLSLAQVVADMRSILTGKPTGEAALGAPGSRTTLASGAAGIAPVGPLPGILGSGAAQPPPAVTYAPASTSAWNTSAPAPVTYVPSGASAGPGGRVLTGNDLANAVRELLRGAQTEICLSSPWVTGVETLVADIVATAPQLKILIVSRRPDKDDPGFHKAMDQLGRRKAITAWSLHIQTRYVIADGKAAIVGAASLPGPASREAGIAITDPATVAALRAHFDRCHVEAAGGRY